MSVQTLHSDKHAPRLQFLFALPTHPCLLFPRFTNAAMASLGLTAPCLPFGAVAGSQHAEEQCRAPWEPPPQVPRRGHRCGLEKPHQCPRSWLPSITARAPAEWAALLQPGASEGHPGLRGAPSLSVLGSKCSHTSCLCDPASDEHTQHLGCGA